MDNGAVILIIVILVLVLVFFVPWGGSGSSSGGGVGGVPTPPNSLVFTGGSTQDIKLSVLAPTPTTTHALVIGLGGTSDYSSRGAAISQQFSSISLKPYSYTQPPKPFKQGVDANILLRSLNVDWSPNTYTFVGYQSTGAGNIQLVGNLLVSYSPASSVSVDTNPEDFNKVAEIVLLSQNIVAANSNGIITPIPPIHVSVPIGGSQQVIQRGHTFAFVLTMRTQGAISNASFQWTSTENVATQCVATVGYTVFN